MTVLLDTNVVSEFRKVRSGRVDPVFRAWAEERSATELFLSVVTVMELRIGVGRLERRDARQASMLRDWLDGTVLPFFDGRVLPFGMDAAERCAVLHVPDPRPERDAMIAATALARGMAVATRNVADFEGTGVAVVNPWAVS